jgi:hypothetical protein
LPLLRRNLTDAVEVRHTADCSSGRGALQLTGLGIAHLVDGVVTSLDVGFRKPHPAFFEAALREAGCAPAACVMIAKLGAERISSRRLCSPCKVFAFAIEEPPPTSSAADAVATDLEAVLNTVSSWVGAGGMIG